MAWRRIGSGAILLGALTTLILMAFGAGISFAKTETTAATYYEDSLNDLCVGAPTAGLFAGSCEWANMTGEFGIGKNVGIGLDVLKSDTTGASNTASGTEALFSNTTGRDNVASGFAALYRNITGSDNVASGFEALELNTEGSGNTTSGWGALFSNTTGSDNVASGIGALGGNTTGSSNVALGQFAGFGLTTGSNNIDISNGGSGSEDGTTRIGTEGKQSRAFVAGIFPTQLTGCFVQVTSEGQLGCNPTAAAEGKEGKEGKEGQVGATGANGTNGATGATGANGAPGAAGPVGATGATGATGPAGDATIAYFESFVGTPSGHCLNFGAPQDQGQGTCTGAPPGFSTEKTVAGPIPDNGAVVSYLHAETTKPLSGTGSVAAIAVKDNDVTLQKCTVTGSKTSCTADAVGGAAKPGDNLEVEVTATGGNNLPWRVSFRY